MGIEYTGGAFDVILPKVRNFLSLLDDADFADLSLFQNTSVSETQEFQKSYFRRMQDPSSLNTIKDPIMCFCGSRNDPRWLDEERRECSCPQASFLMALLVYVELYSTLCFIKADLSHIPKLRKYSNHIRGYYYEVKYNIVLSFGLTEFKAFIAWRENVRSLSCL